MQGHPIAKEGNKHIKPSETMTGEAQPHFTTFCWPNQDTKTTQSSKESVSTWGQKEILKRAWIEREVRIGDILALAHSTHQSMIAIPKFMSCDYMCVYRLILVYLALSLQVWLWEVHPHANHRKKDLPQSDNLSKWGQGINFISCSVHQSMNS